MEHLAVQNDSQTNCQFLEYTTSPSRLEPRPTFSPSWPGLTLESLHGLALTHPKSGFLVRCGQTKFISRDLETRGTIVGFRRESSGLSSVQDSVHPRYGTYPAKREGDGASS